MTDTLYIRLGSQQTDAVHWLVWSSTHNTVIEEGEVTSAENLVTIKDKTNNRKVIVLVPGCDVSLKALTVPGKSQRAIHLAAPYMLEDDLAQDVEQLFFAYGNQGTNSQGNNCFVAAIAKQQMDNWLFWLSEAGISTKILMPDVFALPNAADADDNWHGVVLNEQILIRQSAWQAAVVDHDNWQVISKAWHDSKIKDDTAVTLNAYSALPAMPVDHSQSHFDEENTFNETESDTEIASGINISTLENTSNGLAVLAKYCSAQPELNLLQGEYKPTQKRSPVLSTWVWAASFAVVALLINLVLKGGELATKENRIASIEQEIINTYKDAFPRTKKVRINTIKSQLKNKMKGIGSVGARDSFLPMLNNLQPAFSLVPDLSIDSLKFDSKRQEIRLKATGSDYQSFEKFTTAVKKMNLNVKQGAQNNKGESISGSFTITSAGNK